MPMNRPPGTFRTTSTPQMMMPSTNTAVGHDVMWPPMPSCTGTVVPAASGMRRTRPPSTKPMMEMNRPMPTAIAAFSDGGIASNTAERKPDTASATMMRPSMTTRPIASAQVSPSLATNVTATRVLMPRPAAMPNGYFAHAPNRMVMTPAANAVMAATCGTDSTVPSTSSMPPRISGLRRMMYAIAKKVTTPPRTSVTTVEPRSVMPK